MRCGTRTLAIDTFYFITGVYDASLPSLSIYVDGVLVGSERAINAQSSHDILVTAINDLGLGRINVTWTIPIYANPPPASVALAGWTPTVFAGVPFAMQPGVAALSGWAPTRIP